MSTLGNSAPPSGSFLIALQWKIDLKSRFSTNEDKDIELKIEKTKK